MVPLGSLDKVGHWLNFMEYWFLLLIRFCVQRGAGASNTAVETAITPFIGQTDATLKPFV